MYPAYGLACALARFGYLEVAALDDSRLREGARAPAVGESRSTRQIKAAAGSPAIEGSIVSKSREMDEADSTPRHALVQNSWFPKNTSALASATPGSKVVRGALSHARGSGKRATIGGRTC